MRITFISPTVNMSGGMKVVVIYAQRLTRMGHSVRIVSPPPPRVPFHRKLEAWVMRRGWPGEMPVQSHLDGSGVNHHVIDCWRPIADGDVPDADVVIATWWETAEWVSALAPSKGAKVYFIQHHEIFSHLPIARCHASYRLPLHKIVVASWLKEVMSVQYGDNIVDVVPNSIDRRQFFAPVRGKQVTPTAGYLHSTSDFKCMRLALAALEIVREGVHNLRLVSFGSESPQSPLPEGTEFFLSPPQNQIRNIYSRCDVWVTGSRSEGFNLPAMEAMACRTPVVATRTGWPEEVMRTGWNGVLVDVNDLEGLARGIEWVLSRNDHDWRSLSSNAYETAASGSWEASAELFEKALRHACLRSKSGEIGGQCACANPPVTVRSCEPTSNMGVHHDQ